MDHQKFIQKQVDKATTMISKMEEMQSDQLKIINMINASTIGIAVTDEKQMELLQKAKSTFTEYESDQYERGTYGGLLATITRRLEKLKSSIAAIQFNNQ